MLDVQIDGAQEIISRMNAKIVRMGDLHDLMFAAAGEVYAGTREWYDSNGEGDWSPLAASTIARKTSQGYADPERPLFAEGNLYESATSPHGPHSFLVPIAHDAIVLGVDWEKGGHQIPVVLATGTNRSGPARNTVIPARPIWPSLSSTAWRMMEGRIVDLFMKAL